jgi:hypothetical protein
MPTYLFLRYDAYIQFKVPNKIARLLKKQQPDSVQECTDTAFAFGNKWGKLFFTGADGNEYEIEGETEETDYKRADYGKWEDEVESDDEEVSDKVTNEKGHVVTEEKMKKLLGEEDEKDEKDEKDEEEPEEDE